MSAKTVKEFKSFEDLAHWDRQRQAVERKSQQKPKKVLLAKRPIKQPVLTSHEKLVRQRA